MGSGESTAKRISMQKTDEGSVQVSEEVMLRLKKGKGQEAYQEPADEIKIKEENLRLLLNDAYKKGRLDGEKKTLKDFEGKQVDTESSKNQNNSKLKDIEESMEQRNVEIEELNKKLGDLEVVAETKLKERQVLLESAKKQLRDEKSEKEVLYQKITDSSSIMEEQSSILQESVLKLEEEKKHKEEYFNMLAARDKSMKVEFEKGVEDVKRMLRPLQKDVLCRDLQQEVVSCYKENRQYPLRCSNIVSQFRECVQNARRRTLERDEVP